MLSDPGSLRWATLLRENLSLATTVTVRGREVFFSDRTLQLAGEALIIRVGDLAKKLVTAEPTLGDDPVWRAAARTRDFVAHHYHRVDTEALWETLTVSFGDLSRALGTIED